jgi:hypothetical protein
MAALPKFSLSHIVACRRLSTQVVVTPGHVDNLAGRVKFGDNKTMRSAKQA